MPRLKYSLKSQMNPMGVKQKIDRNGSRLVWRVGAYGRTVMKNNQLSGRNGQYSKPGETPRYRVGTMKRFTLYGLADAGMTAVVGVLPLPRAPHIVSLHGRRCVPELLNEGGAETFILRRRGQGRVTAHYQPRPFTLLALGPTLAFRDRLVRGGALARYR